ncbi:MAG: PAS domain S-box protein [Solirubrobacterales bacterium]|nr:PAS domain S-box protein [Solirubrobacterales bacterium]
MLRRHIAPAVVVVAAVIMLALVGVRITADRSHAAAARVQRAERVLDDAQLAERHVIDLETGLRGYLATRARLFLAPWSAARAVLRAELGELEGLTSGQDRRLAVGIAAAVDRYEAGYAQPLLASPPARPGIEATFAAGKRRMDALRARFAVFDRLQLAHQAAAQRDAARAQRTFSVVGIAAAVVLLIALVALVAYLARVVVAPLRRAIAICVEIGEGRRAASLEPSGSPEVRELAGAFNAMLARLEDRERALADQARMLADSQATAHVGSWEWDLSQPRLRWTDELCRLFGQVPGFSPTFEEFLAFVHPDDRPDVTADVDACRRGVSRESEYRIVRPDGDVRTLHALRFARFDDTGVVTRLVGTIQDVTEQRAVERARERAVGQVTEAQRIAQIGSWTWDAQTGVATWSEEMYRIFGRDPQDGPVAGEALMNYVHPDDRGRLAAAYGGVLQSGGEFEVDYRIVTGDGDVRALHAIARRDPQRPGSAVGTAQDVTAQRAAERALRDSEQRFRETLAHAPIGMALVSPEGRWLQVNQAMCEITGYAEDELEALTHQAITHPDDLDADAASVASLLAGEIPSYRMQKRYLHKRGHVVWIELSVSLLRDECGNPVDFIAQVQDISAMREAQRRQADTSQRLQSILENLDGSAVVLYDRELRLRFCEGPLFGTIELDEMIGRRLPEFVDERVMELMTPGLDAALSGATSSAVLDRDDEGRTLAMRFAPYRRRDGAIEGVLVHWHDMSILRDTERDRDTALEQFQAAFDRAPIGIAVLAPDGRFERVNDALCELTGHTAQELCAMAPLTIVSPHDVDRVRDGFTALHDGTSTVSVEHRLTHPSGREVWVDARATMIRDADDHPHHILAQIQDVTERRRHEARLEHMADHDPLTGLLNRRDLQAVLEAHLARCRRYGAGGAVLMLDLDGFKRVNDTHGHAIGDELLLATARALKGRLRATDAVARFGGDEFAILLPREDRAQAQTVAAALLSTVRARAEAISNIDPGTVTASIGMAMFTDTRRTVEQMLALADRAMYEAKQNGRDRYVVHDQVARGRSPVAAQRA